MTNKQRRTVPRETQPAPKENVAIKTVFIRNRLNNDVKRLTEICMEGFSQRRASFVPRCQPALLESARAKPA